MGERLCGKCKWWEACVEPPCENAGECKWVGDLTLPDGAYISHQFNWTMANYHDDCPCFEPEETPDHG